MEQKPLNKTERQELQKNWPAKSIFKCNGKVMKGNPRDECQFRLVFIVIILVLSYVFIFLAEPMWNDIHPATVFGFIFLSLATIYNKFVCRYSDPGILLRGNIEEDPFEKKDNPENQQKEQQDQIQKQQSQPKEPQEEITKQNSDQTEQQEHKSIFPPIQSQIQEQSKNQSHMEEKLLNSDENKEKEILVKQNINNEIPEKTEHKNKISPEVNELKIDIPNSNQNPQKNENNQEKLNIHTERYCRTCKIIKPPLASHCSHCDQCITQFDHHCYVVGNCIGERNYRNFYLMLLGYTAMIIYITVMCSLVLSEKLDTYPDFFSDFGENKNVLYYVTVVSGVLLIMTTMCSSSLEVPLVLIIIFMTGFLIRTIGITSDEGLGFLDNPGFSILGILFMVLCSIFVIPVAMYNCYNVFMGLTLKEITEIERKNKQKHYSGCNPLKNCGNCFKVLFYSKRPSSILIE